MKKSGILLHISSLATEYGIGDLGPAAYRFADYLKNNAHSYWQVLPLNHCGYGNSPYNPISAFAFDKFLISPELLFAEGYLSEQELSDAKLPAGNMIDVQAVIKSKGKVLELAAERMLQDTDIDQYIEANAWHLKPYLAFCIISEVQQSSEWYLWPKPYRQYSDELFLKLGQDYKDRLRILAMLQKVCEDQLTRLKSYLSQSGIALFGDIPIYLSYESAEVWAHQELFELDQDGRRLSVAGVPPDAFSVTGQLWGNPIYRWDRMQENGFELFVRRFAHILKYIDLIRLDHFIGYVNYWKVPCPEARMPENAEGGSWVRACPEAFFDTILSHFPLEAFIAEDLGILNEDVCRIRDSYGFPGMIILQFCFEDSVPEVQSYPSERFIYTGTHDNQTTRGWWESLPENSPSRLNLAVFCKRFLPQCGLPNADNVHQILIEIARISACERYIVPMQDVLGLDDDARMNIPGTALGNWQWRLLHRAESKILIDEVSSP